MQLDKLVKILDEVYQVYYKILTAAVRFALLPFLITRQILDGKFKYEFEDEDESHLNRAKSRAALSREIAARLSVIERNLGERISNLESYERPTAFYGEGAEVADIIKERVDEALGDNILDSISEYVSKKSTEIQNRNRLSSAISDGFLNIRIKLDEYSQKSEKSASKFLTFGLIFAILGVGAALYIFFNFFFGIEAHSVSEFPLEKIIYHLPFSIPLIILCEILALIMFRYHSRSLEQMRQFVNESNTLTLKQIGVEIALRQVESKDLQAFAHDLLKSERNFILKKGEKTIETAHNEIESSALSADGKKMVEFYRNWNPPSSARKNSD